MFNWNTALAAKQQILQNAAEQGSIQTGFLREAGAGLRQQGNLGALFGAGVQQAPAASPPPAAKSAPIVRSGNTFTGGTSLDTAPVSVSNSDWNKVASSFAQGSGVPSQPSVLPSLLQPSAQSYATFAADNKNPDGSYGMPTFKRGTAFVKDKTGKGNPKKDTVPAVLAEGEAVLNAGAAAILGRDKIAALNKKGAKRLGLRGSAKVVDGKLHAVQGYVPAPGEWDKLKALKAQGKNVQVDERPYYDQMSTSDLALRAVPELLTPFGLDSGNAEAGALGALGSAAKHGVRGATALGTLGKRAYTGAKNLFGKKADDAVTKANDKWAKYDSPTANFTERTPVNGAKVDGKYDHPARLDYSQSPRTDAAKALIKDGKNSETGLPRLEGKEKMGPINTFVRKNPKTSAVLGAAAGAGALSAYFNDGTESQSASAGAGDVVQPDLSQYANGTVWTPKTGEDSSVADEAAYSKFFTERGITDEMRQGARQGARNMVSSDAMLAAGPRGYQRAGAGVTDMGAPAGMVSAPGEAGLRARNGMMQRDFTPGQMDLINQNIRDNNKRAGVYEVNTGDDQRNKIYKKVNKDGTVEYTGMGNPTRIAAEEAAKNDPAQQQARLLHGMRMAALGGSKEAADIHGQLMQQAGFEQKRLNDLELKKMELDRASGSSAQEKADKRVEDNFKVVDEVKQRILQGYKDNPAGGEAAVRAFENVVHSEPYAKLLPNLKPEHARRLLAQAQRDADKVKPFNQGTDDIFFRTDPITSGESLRQAEANTAHMNPLRLDKVWSNEGIGVGDWLKTLKPSNWGSWDSKELEYQTAPNRESVMTRDLGESVEESRNNKDYQKNVKTLSAAGLSGPDLEAAARAASSGIPVDDIIRGLRTANRQ